MNKIKSFLIIGTILLLISTVSAAYQIWSNTITVTVTPQATLQLTVNTTLCIVGEGIKLTATLSDELSGIQVTFYENNIAIGDALTSVGVAVYERTMNNPGTFSFNATCIHP